MIQTHYRIDRGTALHKREPIIEELDLESIDFIEFSENELDVAVQHEKKIDEKKVMICDTCVGVCFVQRSPAPSK
jgi:hypothetical protein